MEYAYADQNFLSNCIGSPAWRTAVIEARNRESVSLVLSPLHFLEIGKAGTHHREDLIRFAEESKPAWAFNMADVEKWELKVVWDWFWNLGDSKRFQVIATLHDVGAAMHNVHPSQVKKFSLRDWVNSFAWDGTGDNPSQIVIDSLKEQGEIALANQEHFRKGRLNNRVNTEIERRHVAIQLSRLQRDKDKEDVYSRAFQFLRTQPLATQIDVFIYWNGLSHLKCYQFEAALTQQSWEGAAKLGPSRVVDRQHACVALPYCDRFVTDDKDLTKRCKAAQAQVSFATARVENGQSFIDSL
jgi:hypothetical protein